MEREDPGENQNLLSELYDELRRRADRMMLGQPRGHTLQATALVHEVFLKLHGPSPPTWEDKAHFLALASRAMRQVLVDHARGRAREKRAAPGERLPLDGVLVSYEERSLDLLALDAALHQLGERDPEMARAVELRFFGGVSVEDAARVLQLPKRTFERRWQLASLWLKAELT